MSTSADLDALFVRRAEGHGKAGLSPPSSRLATSAVQQSSDAASYCRRVVANSALPVQGRLGNAAFILF